MSQIPSKFNEGFGELSLTETAVNKIIDYLHVDKKLRDEQYAAVAAFVEKTGVLISDMKSDPVGEQFTKMLEDMGAEIISTGRPLNFERE